MKLSLINILILAGSSLFAQKAIGIVRYQFILHYDSPVVREATLLLNKTESVFTHSKGPKGVISITPDGMIWDQCFIPEQIGGWYQDEIGAVCYKNRKTNQLVIREFENCTAILVKEPALPGISWKLIPETMKIGQFTCQLAIATFRGRTYEAWFTAEIPIPEGPWKLHGLPGLILEAYDQSREVQFRFKSFQVPTTQDSETIIRIPSIGKEVKFEAYKRFSYNQPASSKRKGMRSAYGQSPFLFESEFFPSNKIELKYE